MNVMKDAITGARGPRVFAVYERERDLSLKRKERTSTRNGNQRVRRRTAR